MNQNKVLYSENAKKQFIEINEKFEKIIQTTHPRRLDIVYGQEFGKLYDQAVEGDLAAQDYLGYIFKRGKTNLVPENIELSLSWQILAAANGNHYTIDRLAIFLNSAYNKFFALDDIDNLAKYFRFNLNNYQYTIGRLLCEAICDELNIQEYNIIRDIPDEMPYNIAVMNKFNIAKDKAVNIVIEYMRNIAYPNKENEPIETKNDETSDEKKKSFLGKIFGKK